MKKKTEMVKDITNNSIFTIVLTVVVSFLGTYLFLPWHGFLSSIPFVIVSAFVCTRIKMNELLKAAIFFVSPFTVSILVEETVPRSFFYALICVLFYVLACFSSKLFKAGKKKFRLASLGILLFSICLHVFVNSTPWSVYGNNKFLNDYLETNYSGEPIRLSGIKFDPFSRTYSVEVLPGYFETTDDIKSASLSITAKNSEIVKDEYIDYCEQFNMIIGRGRITKVIRTKYPNVSIRVEGDQIYGYPFASSATINPSVDYSKYMDFSVYFTTYKDIDKFIELSEDCYRALVTSGFCCRNITFYAGIGTRYTAKISVPFSSMTDHLGNFVEMYEDGIFTVK